MTGYSSPRTEPARRIVVPRGGAVNINWSWTYCHLVPSISSSGSGSIQIVAKPIEVILYLSGLFESSLVRE